MKMCDSFNEHLNKTNQLLELISEWSKDSKVLDGNKLTQCALRLKALYQHDFRHNYSEISAHLSEIMLVNNEAGECLAQNIEIIRDYFYKNENFEDESTKSVIKLYDHITLEIGHFNFFRQLSVKSGNDSISAVERKQLQQQIDKTKEDIENSKSAVTKAVQTVEKIDDKIEKNAVSSLTTLTIFSAVILAFSGSIAFADGVFTGIALASKYRIIFVSSIIGLVVFNTIFLLLYIISRMTDKNLECKCIYNIDTDDKGKGRCGFSYCIKKLSVPTQICSAMRKYPYIVLTNATILLIMYYDFVIYVYNENEFRVFGDMIMAKYIILWMVPAICFLGVYILFRIYQAMQLNMNITRYSLALLKRNEKSEAPFVNMLQSVAMSINRLFSSDNQHDQIYDEIDKVITEDTINANKKKQKIKNILKNRILKELNEEKYYLHTIQLIEMKYEKKELDKYIEEMLEKKPISDANNEIIDDEVEVIDEK